MTESKAPAKKTYKVGDVWKLPKGNQLVVLPDGSAVTARGSYPLTAPGTYKCGKATITVAKPK